MTLTWNHLFSFLVMFSFKTFHVHNSRDSEYYYAGIKILCCCWRYKNIILVLFWSPFLWRWKWLVMNASCKTLHNELLQGKCSVVCHCLPTNFLNYNVNFKKYILATARSSTSSWSFLLWRQILGTLTLLK